MPRSKTYQDDVVLERAMNVFWVHGYEGTSVRLLEKEMRINQFSIYSSFNDKRNLFIKSLQQYREYVAQNVYQDLLKETAGFSELKNFLQNAIQRKNKKDAPIGCLVVNTAAEFGENDEEIAREINHYYDFIRDMLKRVLQNAIVKKEIPVDTKVEKQANFFLGVMQSISITSKTMVKSQLKDFISVALSQIK